MQKSILIFEHRRKHEQSTQVILKIHQSSQGVGMWNGKALSRADLRVKVWALLSSNPRPTTNRKSRSSRCASRRCRTATRISSRL